MSAIGTKRTWAVAPQMSAFGSKADIGAFGLLGWRRKRARVTCSSFEPPTVSARQKNGLGATAIATGWGCLSGRGRPAWRPFLCASLARDEKFYLQRQQPSAAPLALNANILSLKNETDLAAGLNPASSVCRFCPRFVALTAGQEGAAPRQDTCQSAARSPSGNGPGPRDVACTRPGAALDVPL